MATHNPTPLPVFSTNDCKRFWAKVKSGEPTECWPWIAGTSQGYGRIRMRTLTLYSHRVAYYLHYGVDTRGQFVLHRCDNPPCCNPSHLFLGTQADNMQDMVRKGRRPFRVIYKTPNDNARVTIGDVRDIRRRYHNGESVNALASEYLIARQSVRRIAKGITWRYVQ